MFDALQRAIADCLVENACKGLYGDDLIESICEKYPAAARCAIASAGFLAVTRATTDAGAILPIYEVALKLRGEDSCINPNWTGKRRYA